MSRQSKFIQIYISQLDDRDVLRFKTIPSESVYVNLDYCVIQPIKYYRDQKEYEADCWTMGSEIILSTGKKIFCKDNPHNIIRRWANEEDTVGF